tara:strand:+ start:885 stop:1025 length:141 start_codon:yes stop_codon:yes gene_type:complete
MTHSEDLLRFKDNRIDSLTREVEKLIGRIEYLEAALQVREQTEINH